MFLTPDGKPFWGGTYFPPDSRYGRPAFVDVLRRVREVYDGDPASIAKNTAALMEAIGNLANRQGEAAPTIDVAMLDQIATRVAREIDPVHGGLGGAPKFPQTYSLEVIWRSYLRNGAEMLRDGVLLSLTKMSQGGIYDHIGGGYARYATDAACWCRTSRRCCTTTPRSSISCASPGRKPATRCSKSGCVRRRNGCCAK